MQYSTKYLALDTIIFATPLSVLIMIIKKKRHIMNRTVFVCRGEL